MILATSAILKAMKKGDIVIEPFELSRVNPNSVNLRLYNKLLRVKDGPLDMKKETPVEEVEITDDGYLLEPGHLYLGRTLEYTETHRYVPLLEGRSSIGRLGIFIHATAGFGDVGFTGFWTLEISVVQPIKIYPNIEICQIYYHEVKGKAIEYHGKYQNNKEIQTSRIYKEFK